MSTQSAGAKSLTVSLERGIARIRFCRPSALNAIDEEMANRLLDAMTSVQRDPSLRVIVLSGEGRAFMAVAICGDSIRTSRVRPTPQRQSSSRCMRRSS